MTLQLKDLYWTGTIVGMTKTKSYKRITYKPKDNYWRMIYMKPLISSERFDFSIKVIDVIKERGGFIIGVSEDSSKTGGYIGTQGHIGWGWNRGYGIASPGKARIPTPREIFGAGDVIKIVVKKKEGAMEFFKNGTLKGTLSGVDFPEKLRIAASLVWPVKFEMIDFNDYGSDEGRLQLPDVHLEPFGDREGEERLDFVLQEYSDLNIPIPLPSGGDDRVIRLPRIILCHSPVMKSYLQSIETEGKVIYKDFKRSLDQIEEKTICMMILNKDVTIRTELIGEYFLFFRHFKLTREMMICLKKLESSLSTLSLIEVFDTFSEFCKCHENEEVKSMFLSDVEETPTFDTSFASFLYVYLKKREDELKEQKIVLPKFHSEENDILQGMEFNDDNISSNMMKKDYFSGCVQQLREVEHNLILETSDGDEVKIHREFLALHFNFFYRMFKFGGREAEEMKENGRIQLMDLSKSVLEMMFAFYFNDFRRHDFVDKTCNILELTREERIDDLIRLIIHSEKFLESELLDLCFTKLAFLVDTRDVEEVKDSLMNAGYYIYHSSTEVKERIVPILSLCKSLSEKGVLKAIRKSNEKNLILGNMERLRKEFGEMKEREKIRDQEIVELRLENMNLKEKVLKLKERVSNLEKKEE